MVLFFSIFLMFLIFSSRTAIAGAIIVVSISILVVMVYNILTSRILAFCDKTATFRHLLLSFKIF